MRRNAGHLASSDAISVILPSSEGAGALACLYAKPIGAVPICNGKVFLHSLQGNLPKTLISNGSFSTNLK